MASNRPLGRGIRRRLVPVITSPSTTDAAAADDEPDNRVALLHEIAERVTRLQQSASTSYGTGYNDGVRAAFKEIYSRLGIEVRCSCGFVVAAPYHLASLTKYIVCPKCGARTLKRKERVL